MQEKASQRYRDWDWDEADIENQGVDSETR